MLFRLSIVLTLGILASTDARGQGMDVYQVKAVFLYNFAKFVEWPANSFKSSSDPIAICILGQDPFGSSLEDAIHGKTIECRAFVVRQIAGAPQARSCQILFIGSSEQKRFRAVLKELKTSGILTVGETEGFAAEYGVVNFKLEGGKIRLEINVGAAEQNRLRISSKLLSLAQIVKD